MKEEASTELSQPSSEAEKAPGKNLGVAAVVALMILVFAGGLFYAAKDRPVGAPTAASAATPPAALFPPAVSSPSSGEIVPPTTASVSQARPAIPAAPEPSAAAAAVPIRIRVTGAVRKPGVYTLRSGDRVYQAVRAAGGFAPGVALDAIDLAGSLHKSGTVNVPRRGLAAPPATLPPSMMPLPPPRRPTPLPPPAATKPPMLVAPAPTVAGSAALAPSPPVVPPADAAGGSKFSHPEDGTINVNTAGVPELQRLPGVGPLLAERIVSYRQAVGNFNAPEQLLDVKGMSEEKFGALQPFVRVK